MDPAILEPGTNSRQVIGQGIQHRGLREGSDHGQSREDHKQPGGNQWIRAGRGKKLPGLHDRRAPGRQVGREQPAAHPQQTGQHPAVKNKEAQRAESTDDPEDHARARGQREQRPEPRDAGLEEAVSAMSAGADQQPRGRQCHQHIGYENRGHGWE